MKRFITVTLLVCALSVAHAGESSRPNIIIYLVDDLGLNDVQEHGKFFPNGSDLYETPNIHTLAAEGMRFNHAYA